MGVLKFRCLCFHIVLSSAYRNVVTAEHGVSDVVDIFDGNSETWSTARLSIARQDLVATSLPSQGLAIFAGGFNGELSMNALNMTKTQNLK